ncbi:MAG TPA: hypothetical protein VJ914_15750 [Pseudonocardiaceae bacterium]|nr:hypothetical protein [Pseudonocardiaceae bacterium]
MREAHAAGARLVHFTESATGVPHKRAMSSTGPDQIGPADWTRIDWTRQQAELGIWTALGSVHPFVLPHRPHNSLYVLSDKRKLVTRYDARMLSTTKVSYLYTRRGSTTCSA